jgi:hypothetical protein
MKTWCIVIGAVAALVLGALGGCSAGDDTTDGARGQCATGGALNQCPEADRTAQGACWRLVDCGAIPLHYDNDPNAFDWDNCVATLQSFSDIGEVLSIDCIANASCDSLQVQSSPINTDNPSNNRVYPGDFACVVLGGGGN